MKTINKGKLTERQANDFKNGIERQAIIEGNRIEIMQLMNDCYLYVSDSNNNDIIQYEFELVEG